MLDLYLEGEAAASVEEERGNCWESEAYFWFSKRDRQQLSCVPGSGVRS